MEDADLEPGGGGCDGSVGSSSRVGGYDYDRMQAAREADARAAGLARHEYMSALDAARAAAPQAGFDLGYAAGVRAGLPLGALRGLLWCARRRRAGWPRTSKKGEEKSATAALQDGHLRPSPSTAVC